MDLTIINELASEQGPMFWVAAAAISLGLTLLVVALAQGLRQIRHRRAKLSETPAAPTVTGAPVPAAAAAAAAALDAYQQTAPAATEDASLAVLLRRLQAAGDRLEQIAAELDRPVGGPEHSSLKSSLQDVEYVFKAGES